MEKEDRRMTLTRKMEQFYFEIIYELPEEMRVKVGEMFDGLRVLIWNKKIRSQDSEWLKEL